MTKWTAIVVLIVVATLAGVVGYVHYFYGKEWGGAALLISAFVGYGLIEWLKTLSTMRAANNALVDAMEKIEGGNIAQFKAIQEFIKVEGAKAKKDNEEEWRLLRNQPQLPATEWTWTDVTQQAALPARGNYEDVVIDG